MEVLYILGNMKQLGVPRGTLSDATIRDKTGAFITEQFHTYIISFYLNAVNPPHPRINVVCSKRKTCGSKHNTVFGGRGWGYTRVGDWYVHCPKRGHFIEVSQHFCPSL